MKFPALKGKEGTATFLCGFCLEILEREQVGKYT